jgi:hypothetical protein
MIQGEMTMNSPGLKAREIEALVYIQSPQPDPAEGSRRRLGTLASHASTMGLSAVMVVAAVLGWVLMRR